MQKTILFIAIVLISACGGEPPSAPAPANPSTEKTQPAKRNNPDQNASTDQAGTEQPPDAEMIAALEKQRIEGYGKLITGEWQAVTDASWIIKVEGNILNQSKDDTPPTSEEFNIHPKCDQGGCFSKYFWCITTNSDCYIVRGVDTKYLNLQIPKSDEVIKFVKL